MSKKPVITSVTSGYQGTETINSNFDSVREAFDNTLSLDGSTPNAMQSDFDANSHNIINANNVYANDVLIDGMSFQGVLSGAYSLLYPGLGLDFTDNTGITVLPSDTGFVDGDKGSITVSGSGTIWTINPAAVTYQMLSSTAISSFAPSVHTHDDRYFTESEVTSLLSGKANTSHSHIISDITSLQTSLDAKANVSHTHQMSDITSGNLGVSRGGTGLTSTPTNGQVLIGNGTGYTLATLTAGPNVTITNSSGGISISAATTGGATLANGDYGDVIVSGTGTVMTIDTGVVNTTKLGGDITTAGKALLDDTDAAAQRTTLGLGSLATLSTVATTNLGGDITTAGKALLDDADASAQRTTLGLGALATLSTVGTAQIQDNSVSGAKIALGSDTQGDVMYYNGTDWARLGAGSTGQVLQTNGVGANPSWATVSGGSGASLTTYTTGSGNWTVPASGTFAFVRLWAGGGSGGHGGSTQTRAGGGGGGGYSERMYILSSLGSAGASIPYVVGAGGAAITVAGTGNAGGDSYFATASANQLYAAGGTGGQGNISTPAGGSGGSNGWISLWEGQAGGSAQAGSATGGSNSWHGGAGGGGAIGSISTAGGTTLGSGGNGGASALTGTATSGSTPGGGGGAMAAITGTSGAGGNGRIEIWVW